MVNVIRLDGKCYTPIFIFSNKNETLIKYINSIIENPEIHTMLELSGGKSSIEKLKILRDGKPMRKRTEPTLPCVRHPDVKPLRWCHAELALVPTKRSLNVLFFETGDEDKPASANASASDKSSAGQAGEAKKEK